MALLPLSCPLIVANTVPSVETALPCDDSVPAVIFIVCAVAPPSPQHCQFPVISTLADAGSANTPHALSTATTTATTRRARAPQRNSRTYELPSRVKVPPSRHRIPTERVIPLDNPGSNPARVPPRPQTAPWPDPPMPRRDPALITFVGDAASRRQSQTRSSRRIAVQTPTTAAPHRADSARLTHDRFVHPAGHRASDRIGRPSDRSGSWRRTTPYCLFVCVSLCHCGNVGPAGGASARWRMGCVRGRPALLRAGSSWLRAGLTPCWSHRAAAVAVGQRRVGRRRIRQARRTRDGRWRPRTAVIPGGLDRGRGDL